MKKLDDRVETVEQVWAQMKARFHPEYCKDLEASFYWRLTEAGTDDLAREFTIKVDHGTFEIIEGPNDAPTVTLTASLSDYLKLVNGELRGGIAMVSRRLKVHGSVQLASKLDSIFM